MSQCFIVRLRRLCADPERRVPWLAALGDERVGRVLDAMLDHPDRAHSLASLADLAGMSRTAFAEHFARAFGRSAMDFLRETRLRHGARLLRATGLPVKAIASRVGFASRSHFSRAFADHFGAAPADYRAALDDPAPRIS